MRSKFPQVAEKIRERLGERVLAGAPQWLTPVAPVARSNSAVILIGSLLGRLPLEDVAALVYPVLLEQQADGSWSLDADGPGDLSLTLEVVEALTTCGDPSAREALSRAVEWLEHHRGNARLNAETLILLSAVTDPVAGPVRRLFTPVIKGYLLRRARRRARSHHGMAMPLALSLLARDKSSVIGKGRKLLELQMLDGSWEGSCRTTVFALAALRHASVFTDDPVFERGWRFLSAYQLWDGEGLVQNPCDASNLLHATALRTLAVTAAETEDIAGGTLSLLHQARTSGGWGLGGMLPTDLLTTALALDALSFAGDIPVDTAWTRRRAVLLLLRSQNSDGGWPLYPASASTILERITAPVQPSRADVTSAAVQALAYSGVQEEGEEEAIQRGVDFLLENQMRSGMWKASVCGSALFTTARALEALMAASQERSAYALERGIRVLAARQQTDGGWSEREESLSTPQHTAWALRALSGAPGVDGEVVSRGKSCLEASLDYSKLLWATQAAAWPMPLSESAGACSDLVSLWALEALAPAGIATRSRLRGIARSRSIFDRSR